MNALCHCGLDVADHAGSTDEELGVSAEHADRCCDCYDALVCDEPKLCEECAAA